MKAVVLLAVALAPQVLSAEGSSVSIRGGDVYLTAKGREARITQDGNYAEAKLSPDQKRLALVRTPLGGDRELIVQQVEAASSRQVAAVRGLVQVEDYSLPVRGSAEWSVTGDALYFLLEFSSTSNYLARLDFNTGRVTPMCSALAYKVIRTGLFRGKIAAMRRKQTLVFPWNWYWLLDDQCTELGPIGSDADLDEFLKRYEGDAGSLSAPAKQEIAVEAVRRPKPDSATQHTAGPSIVVRDGDAYLMSSGGGEARITREGGYTEAQLSPSRTLVALIRKPSGADPELSVRLADVDNHREVAGVRGRVVVGNSQLPVLGSPAWAPGSGSLYFLQNAGMNTGYISRLELSSGQVIPMCEALSLAVVPSGEYRGKIVAKRRKESFVSPWEWYWLIDDKCMEVGPIGDEENLEEFYDRYGGERTTARP